MQKYLFITLLSGIVNLLAFNALGQDNLSNLNAQLDKALSTNNNELSIQTYIQLGDYYVKEGKVNKGQRYYQRGAKLNKDDKYPKLAILFHQHYARSYINQEKYKEALSSYESALSIAKKINAKEEITQLNREINQFKNKRDRKAKAKKELEELKSMNKTDAIKYINQRNKEDSLENEQFFNEIHSLNSENVLKEAKLRNYQNELNKKELRIELLNQYNQAKTAENEKNKAYLALKDIQIEKSELESKRQQNIILFFIIGSVLLLVIIIIAIIYYRRQKKLNLLLLEKNKIIYQKNAEMISSLNYAHRIQKAILIGSKQIDTFFPNYFILNQPKDIVSGDFFWINKTQDNKTAWAVVDCTGHGVPGAFMSIIGNQMLNEIILERNITDPGEVLNEMKKGIVHSLNQKGGEDDSQDGMDMALCIWDPKTNILEYAGANNNIYIFRENLDHTVFTEAHHKLKIFENRLIEIKADRKPVGFSPFYSSSFDTFSIQLQKGDIVFAMSDGFQDQFGGPENKKYTIKRLKQLMIEVDVNSIHDYHTIFRNELINWKGNTEQIDDICIVGVRI